MNSDVRFTIHTAFTERVPVITRRDTAAYEHAHASRVRICKCKSTVCAHAAESVFYTKAIKVRWYSCRSHCCHREHMRGMKIWILSMTLCRQRQPLMSKSNTHTRTHTQNALKYLNAKKPDKTRRNVQRWENSPSQTRAFHANILNTGIRDTWKRERAVKHTECIYSHVPQGTMWKEGGLIINSIIMECILTHTHACMHRRTTEPLHTKHAGCLQKSTFRKVYIWCNMQKNSCYATLICSHNL